MGRTFLSLLVFLTIGINSYSQNMTIMDLYTVEASAEIDVIHNYLVNNKKFKLYKNYSEEKDKDGWAAKVYIFTYNSNIIKVNIASKLYNGKLETITQIEYKIFTKKEYDYFVKSLTTFAFEVYKKIKTDDNKKVVVYSKKSTLRMFAITDMGDYYRIAGLT